MAGLRRDTPFSSKLSIRLLGDFYMEDQLMLWAHRGASGRVVRGWIFGEAERDAVVSHRSRENLRFDPGRSAPYARK